MGLWLLTRPLGFIFRPIGLLMKGDFRGLFALLLGFALLGALWETALFSLSTPKTATAVMTEAGVAVVNPALGSMGVGPTVLASIQADAAVHPTDPVAIPGLKTRAIGLTKQDLVGLTFDQATRKIYGNVATAYYASGPDAVFTASVPTISLFPDTHLDWLAALGLSPGALTTTGHSQTQTLAFWLWGAAALLGLLVVTLSKGWARLFAVSQALFTGAAPGLALIGVVWLLWQRAPGAFGPFAALLTLMGDAVVPVYVGAGLVAVAALSVGTIGSAIGAGAAGARAGRRAPSPVGAPAYRPFNAPVASAPNVYSNMGNGAAAIGGPAEGAWPASGVASPYSLRPYGQSQAYGQYDQGQPYGQGISYQRSQSAGPSQGQISQSNGADDAASEAWLGDQAEDQPQSLRPQQPRAYPDYRRYQQPPNPSPYRG
jgi:hypothetical protein